MDAPSLTDVRSRMAFETFSPNDVSVSFCCVTIHPQNVNAYYFKSLFKSIVLQGGSFGLCSATRSAGGWLIWKALSWGDSSLLYLVSLSLQQASPSLYMTQRQDFKCMRGAIRILEGCTGNWEMSLLLHSLGQSKLHDDPRSKGWRSRFHPK